MTNCDEYLKEEGEGKNDDESSSSNNQLERVDKYTQCIQSKLNDELEDIDVEYQLHNRIRRTMADEYSSKYACSTTTIKERESTPPVYNRTWHYRLTEGNRMGVVKEYLLQILHEHHVRKKQKQNGGGNMDDEYDTTTAEDDASWIVKIQDFITRNECAAIRQVIQERKRDEKKKGEGEGNTNDNDSDSPNKKEVVELSWNLLDTLSTSSLQLQGLTTKMYMLAQALLSGSGRLVDFDSNGNMKMHPMHTNHNLFDYTVIEPYDNPNNDTSKAVDEGSGGEDGGTPGTCVMDDATGECTSSDSTTSLAPSPSPSTSVGNVTYGVGALPTKFMVDTIQRLGTIFMFCPLEDYDGDEEDAKAHMVMKGEDIVESRVEEQKRRQEEKAKDKFAVTSASKKDDDDDEIIIPPNPYGSGALRFPYANVHVNPEPYTAIFATHPKHEVQQEQENDEDAYDDPGFTKEYHLCPNSQVLIHEFYTSSPAGVLGQSNEDADPTKKKKTTKQRNRFF